MKTSERILYGVAGSAICAGIAGVNGCSQTEIFSWAAIGFGLGLATEIIVVIFGLMGF